MARAGNRDLNKGFGDALSRAVELVVTPGIFAFLGWLLDRALGTTPVFAFVLGLLVLGYVIWKMWSRYEREMQAQERKLGLGAPGGAKPHGR
jgi:F0F1-type ATP synthase assembly protein I